MIHYEAKRVINPDYAEHLEGWKTKVLGVFTGEMAKEWAINAIEIDATKFVIEQGDYKHDEFVWIPGADTATFQCRHEEPIYDIIWTVRAVAKVEENE